jgi:hypothetical protein
VLTWLTVRSAKQQEELEELVGDGKWWEREPWARPDSTMSHCVPDPKLAIEQLKILYDARTCQRLVRSTSSHLVTSLFLGPGFVAEIDEYLQLGFDLSDCAGWETRSNLIGDLRAQRNFDGARFEVGVCAGLARVGLQPELPADQKSNKRLDLLCTVDGVRVAIELKGLADPDRDRNVDTLRFVLHHCLRTRFKGVWEYDFTLTLSDAVQEQLEEQVEIFTTRHLPTLEQEFEAHHAAFAPNATVALPTLGNLVIAYRPWSAGSSYAGSFGILPDETNPHALLWRAMRKLRYGAGQVTTVGADVRLVVVWGSRAMLPAAWAAEGASSLFLKEPEAWQIPVDWAVFYNAHTLGRRPGLTIDIATAQFPHSKAPFPSLVIDALRAWGVRRRARDL